MSISDKLEEHIKNNSFITTRNTALDDIELESFRINLSKPIIDEIDKVLARHYGFTEEELDFIINYDIKYRMGDELNGEE
jgi:predicted nucleotide-binding protein (sugar kinase/HSP70/actin superfamily)